MGSCAPSPMGLNADCTGPSRTDQHFSPRLETAVAAGQRGHCRRQERDSIVTGRSVERLPMRRPILYLEHVFAAASCDRVHRFRLIARAYFFHESSCGRRITTVGGRWRSADCGNDRGRGRCRFGGQSGRPHGSARDRTTRQQLIPRTH